MRRNNQAAAEDEAQIDLTPMLDVVFIMLIFFIVTASFIKEAGIEVNRPEASTSQPKENVNILVAISANNEVWMDKRRVDVRAVRANKKRLLIGSDARMLDRMQRLMPTGHQAVVRRKYADGLDD